MDSDWTELDSTADDPPEITLGDVTVLERSARADDGDWADKLRTVAQQIRDGNDTVSNRQAWETLYPSGRMPREWWRDVAAPALAGAHTTDGAGSIVRQDVWTLDPETAPDSEAVKRELRERPDREIGRRFGTSAHDTDREARLRRQVAFGCYRVLRRVATEQPHRRGVSTAHLVKRGQREANVTVAGSGQPIGDGTFTEAGMTRPWHPVDPITGEVNCRVFEEAVLPVLASIDGVNRPPVGSDDAWVFEDSVEHADVSDEMADAEEADA
jgi:hypothetical protein